jgi:hypothetical protein
MKAVQIRNEVFDGVAPNWDTWNRKMTVDIGDPGSAKMDDLAISTHPSQSAEGQPGAEAGAQGSPPPPPTPPHPDHSWIEFDSGYRNQDPGVIERGEVIEPGDEPGTGDMTTRGSVSYGEFIEAELKAENDRRVSVHTRAGAAVTSSAGLITLAIAVFGLLVGRGFLVGKNHIFPGSAKLVLLFAVVFLVLAGVCAIWAGFPVGREFVSDRTLNKMLNSHRDDSKEVARDTVAYINAMGLVSLRRRTTKSAFMLFASGIFQILAMVFIVGCISLAMRWL